GRRPFEADSPVATALAHLRNPVPELPASVPTDLALVVRRGMSKKPEDRFEDGSAFATALRDPATHAVPLPETALAPEAAPVPTAATAVIDPHPGTEVFTPPAAGTGALAQPLAKDDPKRNGTVLAVVAVVLAAALIIGGLVWWQS